MTIPNKIDKGIHVRFDSGQHRLEGIPIRLSEKCNSFFELSLARGLSHRTIRAYAFDLAIYFRWRNPGVYPFRKTTQRELAEFIKFQRNEGSAPASINRRLNSTEVFYQYCFGCPIPHSAGASITREANSRASMARSGGRFLGYDATLGVFPIYKKQGKTLRVRVPQVQIRPLEPQQVHRFIEALQCDRDRAITLLMLFSGLRLSEVIALKLEDINRLSGSIRFLGKAKKERTVPMSPLFVQTLDRYLEHERPIRVADQARDLIFLGLKGESRGNGLTPEGLRSIFRAARQASGVRNANPHRFRHTFAANLAANGVSLLTIQRLLGHSDPRTSIKYIWLFPKHIRSEYDRANGGIQKQYESIARSI